MTTGLAFSESSDARRGSAPPAITCHGITVQFDGQFDSKTNLPLKGQLDVPVTSHSASGAATENKRGTPYLASNAVLQDLDLVVDAGEIVSLLGASGCGKSTLLRVIAGLLKPLKGDVLLHGIAPSETGLHGQRNAMSFVFQESALLPWRTVRENVQLPFELDRNLSTKVAREEVEHWLRTVGLDSKGWQKKPNQLSGGMKMRASIARSMVTSPSILLMDEPFAALDDVLRGRLCDLVLEIAKSKKRTVLFVTHNIAEAVYLSDRIDVMAAGRIADSIPVAFHQQRTAELRSSQEFMQFYAQAAQSLFKNTGAS